MASSSSNPNSAAAAAKTPRPPPYDLSRTTYVQTNPSNFRAVVQRLTGSSSSSSSNLAIASMPEIAPRRPPFNLHERRQSARKLEISLGAMNRGFVNEKAMVSPASTLDLFTQESPPSPAPATEEEAIAAKGYYFHPNTPRSSKPELLDLFPLHSPRERDD